MERIAVFGAGNGGQCMAADLTLGGHEVVLCEMPAFAERLRALAPEPVIELSGIGRTGSARLAGLTFDVGEAARAATLLNVVVPAFGQQAFFEALAPHLRDGHIVVLWAGDFGSLALRELLRERGPGLDVHIVETNTLPYGTRLIEPGRVVLPLLAPLVLAAALPADAPGPALPLLRELWPCVEPGADVLGVALSNPNPVVHPPGSLLNTGRIEYSGGDFNMYREGITEAVARVIRAVHGEVSAVADALGTSVLEYRDGDYRTKTSVMGVAFRAPFDTDAVIGDIAGPHSIEDRYITEDLPYGLVPVAELGERVGVATPLIESIVTLGSSVCGRDFWNEGRGLDQLGLAGLGRDEILATVRDSRAATAAPGD